MQRACAVRARAHSNAIDLRRRASDRARGERQISRDCAREACGPSIKSKALEAPSPPMTTTNSSQNDKWPLFALCVCVFALYARACNYFGAEVRALEFCLFLCTNCVASRRRRRQNFRWCLSLAQWARVLTFACSQLIQLIAQPSHTLRGRLAIYWSGSR